MREGLSQLALGSRFIHLAWTHGSCWATAAHRQLAPGPGPVRASPARKGRMRARAARLHANAGAVATPRRAREGALPLQVRAACALHACAWGGGLMVC
jgi:hypothetical protein